MIYVMKHLENIKIKSSLAIFFAVIALSLLSTPASAEVQFDIVPTKNPVAEGEETEINVFINTDGDSVTLARIVLDYDPDVIQVSKVEHASSFCTYPDTDEDFYVNNKDGQVKLTGFCDTTPFTSSEFKLFGKFTVKGRSAGTTNIEAAFSQAGGINETAAYDDKSPPQNLLSSEPSTIQFGVGTSVTPQSGTIPSTAISREGVFAISVGIVILGVGLFIILKFYPEEEKKSFSKLS